jgi:type IV secretion system protein VirB8
VSANSSTEEYLEAGRSWDSDRAQSARRSARRAWQVAAIAVALSAAAILALAVLTPLRTVEPYLIRVDASTGVVDVVPAYRGTATVDELITRHLLQMYVISRERYVAALAESDYELVGAMQTSTMNQAWLQLWDRGRADSPLNVYRDGTVVRVQVQAISFLKIAGATGNVAQVRFLTLTRPAGNGSERTDHWVSTLSFAYGAPPKDERVRLANPLGLRVAEYQREQEINAGEGAAS